MRDPHHLNDQEYLAMAEILKVQREAEQMFGMDLDIQPPGINLYLKYEFVLATPATAVGKTRQPT
jgi:hypothetical protein